MIQDYRCERLRTMHPYLFPAKVQNPRPFLAAFAPTLVVAGLLAVSQLAPPAGIVFYLCTALSALLLWGNWWIHGGRGGFSSSTPVKDAALGLGAGLGLAGVFAAGAFVVQRVPFLAGQVDELLASAAGSALLPTLLVAALNGIGEEAHYRYTVVRHLPYKPATVYGVALGLYVFSTVAMGTLLLPFAALALGALAHWLSLRTGNLVAASICHITWSFSMILALPRLL